MHKKKLVGLLFPRYLRILDIVNRNALLMDWIRTYASIPTFADRESYFSHINDRILLGRQIDYLEFGVYQGASIDYWSKINTNPGSRFWGFDTFEGLPEAWELGFQELPKGYFSTQGTVPSPSDRRIAFVKGLFQDTVDNFLEGFQPAGTLVIHMDPDLYTSALYVLTRLDPYIVKGAILMFDEFSSVLNEFRAFHDYVKSYRRTFRPLAAVTDVFDQHAIAVGASDAMIDDLLAGGREKDFNTGVLR